MHRRTNFLRKGALIVCSGALTALIISYFYAALQREGPKEDIGVLSEQESDIIKRSGGDEDVFCSIPSRDLSSCLAWSDQGHSSPKSLKLVLDSAQGKYFLGVHYSLTLTLRQYLERGVFTCWIKCKKRYPQTKAIDICFKEGPGIWRLVGASAPIESTGEWQKVSIALNQFRRLDEAGFRPISGDGDFTWEIQEILFSVSPWGQAEGVELSVADVVISDAERAVYELF